MAAFPGERSIPTALPQIYSIGAEQHEAWFAGQLVVKHPMGHLVWAVDFDAEMVARRRMHLPLSRDPRWQPADGESPLSPETPLDSELPPAAA